MREEGIFWNIYIFPRGKNGLFIIFRGFYELYMITPKETICCPEQQFCAEAEIILNRKTIDLISLMRRIFAVSSCISSGRENPNLLQGPSSRPLINCSWKFLLTFPDRDKVGRNFTDILVNKPAAQAAGADPSRCSFTNRQSPPIQQSCRNSWTNHAIFKSFMI